jgi:hypothetical protein
MHGPERTCHLSSITGFKVLLAKLTLNNDLVVLETDLTDLQADLGVENVVLELKHGRWLRIHNYQNRPQGVEHNFSRSLAPRLFYRKCQSISEMMPNFCMYMILSFILLTLLSGLQGYFMAKCMINFCSTPLECTMPSFVQPRSLRKE